MEYRTNGWVSLHRNIRKNPIIWRSKSPAIFKVAMACLLQANIEDKVWLYGNRELLIKRGSFVTSFRKLSSYCCLSLNTIRHAINRLENNPFNNTFLHTERHTQFIVISICNYDTYQTNKHNNHTLNDTLNDTKCIKPLPQLNNNNINNNDVALLVRLHIQKTKPKGSTKGLSKSIYEYLEQCLESGYSIKELEGLIEANPGNKTIYETIPCLTKNTKSNRVKDKRLKEETKKLKKEEEQIKNLPADVKNKLGNEIHNFVTSMKGGSA